MLYGRFLFHYISVSSKSLFPGWFASGHMKKQSQTTVQSAFGLISVSDMAEKWACTRGLMTITARRLAGFFKNDGLSIELLRSLSNRKDTVAFRDRFLLFICMDTE